jgi:leucyl-tRNA synthetase
MSAYDHKKIEKKWQEKWEKEKPFHAEENSQKEKLYVLDMFPYPSGAGLHVGHVEGYTATDIYSRFKRMQGYNVLHPMGWDAFGLPAENYAIKTGTPPAKTTNDAIKTFRAQIKSLGLSYDWEREIGTHTPEYYKWTQWFFLFLYKNGLAEKKTAKVNWDPIDQTVLANEQVLPDGTAERSGAKVIQKNLEQWFFKITDFADALIDDLDKVDWPESTKINQRNWIGRSEGAEIDFGISGRSEKIKIFTTRPDTLLGATYMVLAPEHPLVDALAPETKNLDEIKKYIAASRDKTDLERQENSKDKTGVELKGVMAINPATKGEIPIFIADYVLGSYGTGAIMAVPAHDERDYEFAKKFNLPIKQVIAPYVLVQGVDAPRSEESIVKFDAETAIIRHWEDPDLYYVVEFRSDHHGAVGGHVEEGEKPEETVRREVAEESGYTDIKKVSLIFEHAYSRGYKVRKSREEECHDRVYLVELGSGARSPITDKETKKGSWMKSADILKLSSFVTHHQLYFQHALSGLPYTESGVLVNSGSFDGLTSQEAKKKITEAVGGKMVKTYRLRDWLISRQRYWGAPIPVVYDPQGKPHPIPEEHLPWMLPSDVEFKPTGTSPLGQSKELLERTEKIFGKGWKPEIDTMDTFVCSSWYYLRFTDPHNEEEFASKEQMQKWLPVDLYMGGAEHTVLHLMYARFFTKALQKYGYIKFDEPFLKLRHQGLILAEDGSKMSKSKGNVVNPDEVVSAYGADSLRLYEMFMGPLEASKPWNTNNILGVRRFLERVWKMQEGLRKSPASGEMNGSPTPSAGDVSYASASNN